MRADASWLDTRLLSVPRVPKTDAANVRLMTLRKSRVRVKIAGNSGPTVVLCPDPPNVIEHYATLIPMLAQRARVVCFELPGFGFSTAHHTFQFSLDEFSDVIIELLESLELGPYVLAIPCVAGLAAIRVADIRRDLVSHVLSVQTPSHSQQLEWARRVDFKGLIATPIVGQCLVRAARDRLAREWYRAALGDHSQVRDYLGLALAAYRDGASYALASAFQALPKLRSSLQPISQPSTVLWGTRDRSHRRTDKRSTRKYLPDAPILEFDDVGHFPDLENPGKFAEVLFELIGGPTGETANQP